MAYVVLSHLQDKQPYTCDKCGVGFDYEDYVRNAYCCKKNAKQVETWYKEKDGTGEYRCMMKSDTWCDVSLVPATQKAAPLHPD